MFLIRLSSHSLFKSVWIHGFLLSIGYDFFFLMPRLSLGSGIFGQWQLLQVGFCIFLSFPFHSLHTSLPSDIIRCYRLIIYSLYSSSRIIHISRKYRLLLVENHIDNPRSGSWVCSLLLKFGYFPGPLSRQS